MTSPNVWVIQGGNEESFWRLSISALPRVSLFKAKVNHIKQLHQILLRHSEKDARHRGQYKTNSNSVAAFGENGTQIGIILVRTPVPATYRRLYS